MVHFLNKSTALVFLTVLATQTALRSEDYYPPPDTKAAGERSRRPARLARRPALTPRSSTRLFSTSNRPANTAGCWS